MTTASQELHLTQSGVSQHVKSFEDMLGVRLFDRIKQRLVPTAQAMALYESCAQALGGIGEAVAGITSGERRLSGTVTVGMPIEFGNNVVMPLLAAFGRENPLVRFSIRLGFASSMNERIMSGDLDFAFVDDFGMDRRITTERVYDEILDLCCSTELLKKFGSPKSQKKYFESLDYVEYQKDEPLLRMWFNHHLGTKSLKLNVRATVMDVQGLARLVVAGMGAGVLPHHLVLKLQKEGGKLHLFPGCGRPLKNSVSVAYLKERSQSPAVAALLEYVKSKLVPGRKGER
jgi:DNA-binding transcriptional LysR family regulator